MIQIQTWFPTSKPLSTFGTVEGGVPLKNSYPAIAPRPRFAPIARRLIELGAIVSKLCIMTSGMYSIVDALAITSILIQNKTRYQSIITAIYSTPVKEVIHRNGWESEFYCHFI